jgi:hypothetical protein
MVTSRRQVGSDVPLLLLEAEADEIVAGCQPLGLGGIQTALDRMAEH